VGHDTRLVIGMSEPRGSNQAVQTAEAGRERRSAFDYGLFAGT
jgi:hypothetical protein